MKVGWISDILLGSTKIVFLENLIDCICFMSIIYTFICNVFIAILMINVRCKYACAL